MLPNQQCALQKALWPKLQGTWAPDEFFVPPLSALTLPSAAAASPGASAAKIIYTYVTIESMYDRGLKFDGYILSYTYDVVIVIFQC